MNKPGLWILAVVLPLVSAITAQAFVRYEDKHPQKRRDIQQKYNEEHNITPRSIVKNIGDVIAATKEEESPEQKSVNAETVIIRLEEEMRKAADELRFEDAAKIRDRIKRLKNF